MPWFWESLALIILFAAGTCATGFAIQTLLGLRLPRTAPERLPFQILLGLALWIPLLRFLSLAGFGSSQIAPGVAFAVTLAATFAAFKEGRLGIPKAKSCLRLVVIPCLGVLLLVLPLWPTVRDIGYQPLNDAFMYVSNADWLQEHSASQAVSQDPYKPAEAQVLRMRARRFGFGAVHVLAIMQAFKPARSALEVLPAALAWGYVLSLMAVVLACRWSLRISGRVVVLGFVLIGLVGGPLSWSVLHSFLRQAYGLPLLLMGIAVASRFLKNRRDPAGWGVATGLTGSALLITYSEALPVLGLGLLGALLFAAVSVPPANGDRKRLFQYAAWAAITFIACSNIELVPMVQGLLSQLSLGVSGWHVPLNLFGFLRLAVGGDLYTMQHASRDLLPLGADILLGLLCSLGVVFCCRRNAAAAPLLSSLGVLVLLFAYFAIFSHDPWSGETGHTWRLFKTAKWSFLWLAVLEIAGLEQMRSIKGEGVRFAVVLFVCCILTLSSLAAWERNLEQNAATLRAQARSEHPARAFRQLKAELAHRQFDTIHLLRSVASPNPWPDLFYTYVLSPFRVASDWSGTNYMDDLPAYAVKGGVKPFGQTLLMTVRSGQGLPARGTDLPGGLVLLDSSRPSILSVRAPNGVEHDSRGELFFWLENKPTELVFSSPPDTRPVLAFTIVPGPDLPRSDSALLRLTQDALSRDFQVVVPSLFWASLEAGAVTRTIALEVCGPSRRQLKKTDLRTLMLQVQDPRILAGDSWVLSNPNGIESRENGSETFWLGPPATILVNSERSCRLELQFEAVPGPSLPESSRRTLRIWDGSKLLDERIVDQATPFRLYYPVNAGVHEIRLAILEKPSVRSLPNGETRSLMLLMKSFSVELTSAPPSTPEKTHLARRRKTQPRST